MDTFRKTCMWTEKEIHIWQNNKIIFLIDKKKKTAIF